MDTRTPRTPTGDRSLGFDDAPALSMVKVPSDPAQVIVNHASFRVQLNTPSRTQSPPAARYLNSTQDNARVPVGGRAVGARRRSPVVWSGRSAPDDTGATRLLQAVRSTSVPYGAEDPMGDAGATQVIPRIGVDGSGGYGSYGSGGYSSRGYGDDNRYDAGGGAYGSGGTYGADDTYGADGGYDADATLPTPRVGGPRDPMTPLLPQMRRAGSAYEEMEETPYAQGEFAGDSYEDGERDGQEYGYGYGDGDGAKDGEDSGDQAGSGRDTRLRAHRAGSVRHAYYPDRRLNLGVVLLPLRVFLGCISIYAGMGKLCDPVYFDGGERGSMVKWLNSLHPWELAEPMRQFALEHPVGSGLLIAFFQVIVGVLTVLGLWQRVAAVVGAMLSAALILTVSWKTVPVYDAPDIIYLAAWSPLIIAGAPVYSVDSRLSGEAWRSLGPRAGIWELRRRVLRRGGFVATVVVGLTLLTGSLLGGAVRDADRVVVPGPGEAPRNELPGSPLPDEPRKRRDGQSPSAADSPTQGGTSASPSGGAASSPGAARESATAGTDAGRPSETQGTGQVPPRQSAAPQAPSTSAGPSSSGGASTGGTGSSGGSGGGSGSGGTGSSGGSGGGNSDRLVGGLLG
ncbi:DoxX family protein [Streptomyces montanus]|uniref:DoxX family protein n=1 Tax=Streptomyces montanus TaxID=2580423 RepID=A0A5R9FRL5_9ACTN|nr:DoxX family protein [Streptomyces montanus]